MSRLDELLRELCPDGVEFQPLNAVAHYAKRRIAASQVDETTYVGVENLLQNKQGKTVASTVPTTGAVIEFNKDDILIGNIRPYLRKIWLADCAGGTNGDVLTVQINDKTALAPKFLYYVLSSEQFFLYDIQNSKGAKMPRGSKDAVMNYPVPVPPLRVQSEIVQILDNFTELTARKNQYQYYRHKLLAFNTGGSFNVVAWQTLEEIADVFRGEYITKKDARDVFRGEYITKKDAREGDIPVILGGQEPAYYIDKANHNGEAVVIARSGESAGFVSYWNEPIFVTDGFGFEAKDGIVIPKYLYYVLKNIERDLNAMKRGAGVPHVSGEALKQVLLPVPSIKVQQRIVSILDRFDTLCNDLTNGLPAEIEARRKQYEYYRDKLLIFKEKVQI